MTKWWDRPSQHGCNRGPQCLLEALSLYHPRQHASLTRRSAEILPQAATSLAVESSGAATKST
jgi:hypothetical protein